LILVFSLYDDRGDDHIPKHYLGEAVRALGLNPTEAEIRLLLTDLNRVERLSMQQFQVIFERLCRQKDSVAPVDEFVDGLRVFDKDGNGLIPATELRHLLTTLGMKKNNISIQFNLIFHI
jgi:Ca2+-binding EF-hand superfamily protein